MKKIIVTVSLVVLALALYTRKSVRDGKTVQIKTGAVQGIISVSRDGRDYYEWLGIPYAKAPVGDLRFASPQPAEKWDGVKPAKEYRSKCAQLELLTNIPVGDEDCLHVNVHVPIVQGNNKLLPVMVYIHGGAYNAMSADDYRPDYFMDEDVAVVVMNYRLGIFGFLNAGNSEIRGNMGLKDQTLALRWVKDNIQSFGGDPEQITIFGESAGAGSVHYQLLNQKGKGLFQRAVSQSGAASAPWGYAPLEAVTAHTHKFSTAAGCPQKDSKDLAKCLRSKTAKELLTAYIPDGSNLPHQEGDLFSPSLEAVNDSEAFLVEPPYDIIRAGKALRVPWITGVNSDEGLAITVRFMQNPAIVDEYEKNWRRSIFRTFGIPNDVADASKVSEGLRNLYFPANVKYANNEEKIQRYTEIFSDSYFNLHVVESANFQRKFSPTYLYHFSRRGGPSVAPLVASMNEEYPFALQVIYYLAKTYLNQVLFGIAPTDLGVSHADELAFEFRMPFFHVPKDDGKDYKFSKDFVKLLVDFAKDRKLNLRGVEFQPLEKTGPLKYFDISETPKMVDEPFKDRLDVLRKLNLIKNR